MSRKKAELGKARIAALYAQGNTTEQISKVFGVTAPTIRKFMKKNGIAIRNSRGFLTNEQKEQLSSMRAFGMTLKQITEAFNVVGMSCIRNNLLKLEEKNVTPSDIIIDNNYTGYNPTQFERKRTKNSNELTLYNPKKWN